MYKFKIVATLNHDKGKSKITLTSIQDEIDFVSVTEIALMHIQKTENCPERAIKKLSITLKDEK